MGSVGGGAWSDLVYQTSYAFRIVRASQSWQVMPCHLVGLVVDGWSRRNDDGMKFDVERGRRGMNRSQRMDGYLKQHTSFAEEPFSLYPPDFDARKLSPS